MTNPSNLVITGLDGYFILNFLQKSGFGKSFKKRVYAIIGVKKS